jgi:hypothetical protein
MHGGGLHKRGVHRRHGLAAILPMMASGRTGHRVAAPHRLLRVGCGSTVEGIRCERDDEQWQKNWFCESHCYQVRRVLRPGQANLTVLFLSGAAVARSRRPPLLWRLSLSAVHSLFLPGIFLGRCFGPIPSPGSFAASAFPVPPERHTPLP